MILERLLFLLTHFLLTSWKGEAEPILSGLYLLTADYSQRPAYLLAVSHLHGSLHPLTIVRLVTAIFCGFTRADVQPIAM